MEYVIQITKREENPDYEPRRSGTGYGLETEQYVSRQVTTATLNEEQWQKVQKAIVEAL